MKNPLTMAQAFDVLRHVKHWRLQCVNRAGKPRRFECTIRDGGHVYKANQGSELVAICAALHKRDMAGPRLHVVGADDADD